MSKEEKLTPEEVAREFGVPPSLLSNIKPGSFDCGYTIEKAEIAFIKRFRRRILRLLKEREKAESSLKI